MLTGETEKKQRERKQRGREGGREIGRTHRGAINAAREKALGYCIKPQ